MVELNPLFFVQCVPKKQVMRCFFVSQSFPKRKKVKENLEHDSIKPFQFQASSKYGNWWRCCDPIQNYALRNLSTAVMQYNMICQVVMDYAYTDELWSCSTYAFQSGMVTKYVCPLHDSSIYPLIMFIGMCCFLFFVVHFVDKNLLRERDEQYNV